MTQFKDADGTLTDHLSQFIDLQKERLMLVLADKASRVIAEAGVKVVFMAFGAISLLLLGLGLAALLNTWMNSPYWGYIIMAALYALGATLFYFRGKRWLLNMVALDILNQIYEDDEHEQESI